MIALLCHTRCTCTSLTLSCERRSFPSLTVVPVTSAPSVILGKDKFTQMELWRGSPLFVTNVPPTASSATYFTFFVKRISLYVYHTRANYQESRRLMKRHRTVCDHIVKGVCFVVITYRCHFCPCISKSVRTSQDGTRSCGAYHHPSSNSAIRGSAYRCKYI